MKRAFPGRGSVGPGARPLHRGPAHLEGRARGQRTHDAFFDVVARGLAIAMVWALTASTVGAAPLLDDPLIAGDGTSLFADSRSASVFYYPPRGLRLATSNDQPRFALIKSVGIGDDGRIAGGGMVALTLERVDPDPAERLAWMKAIARPASLRPLPADVVRWRLSVTAADQDSAPVLAERTVPWSRRSVSFALDTAETTLLWSALERPGNLALIADVEVVTRGYERQPSADPPEAFVETERIDRFSIPLDISRQTHPTLFSLIHRAEARRFDYQRLAVYCFDFAESERWSHVLVDVRMTTPRGQIEHHSVSFTSADDPLRSIDFELPAHPDHPAHFRVTRLDRSGNRRTTTWKEIDHEHLDVTLYEIEIGRHE